MKRIMIIGPCGAGKSTAGALLAGRLGLPLIHMDQLGWQSGWQEVPKAQLEERVIEEAGKEQWIIEGNYGGTLNLRLPRADTVVYLDYPIRLCLWRIIKRWAQYRGRSRPDMGENCPERLSPAFLWYVARWNSGPRLRTEARLVGYEDKIVRIKSPHELDEWLASLATPKVENHAGGAQA